MNNIEIIAEVGSVHDGSFGNAKKLIELAKKVNANTVKFQTHIAFAETLEDAPLPPYFKGEPRYQYFERTGFSKEQWRQLKEHSHINDINFLSSPFSLEAIELLEDIGVEKYKIASGEVTNIPLIEKIAETRKVVLLSSGMSTWAELDKAVDTILKTHSNIVVMQCASRYPCSYESVGLNVMLEMKDRYGLPIGLSDHTLTNYSAFAAVTLGATVIEKHLTFSREMYGSDASLSLIPTEFEDLVKGIEAIDLIRNSKVSKDGEAKALIAMKETFEKSIVASVDIPKNTLINLEMLHFKKPGYGISASEYKNVIGKTTKVGIKKNTLIKKEDIS